ncbi:protein of unknown function [Bartonella clarridgeiae 73]|uniref:Uncharacterized protein n=1 Tax=Bartonella clarridgeiae (strain CCUG 45776 / CIP 104772 / 73) TaxID=696125 RepID=E6YIX1_BARC7|nr:protein of unknown function [Bartonella clarridgeiae 73]CBI76827.1 protein of unknown function [Bartonella clarridgeiae 73]
MKLTDTNRSIGLIVLIPSIHSKTNQITLKQIKSTWETTSLSFYALR